MSTTAKPAETNSPLPQTSSSSSSSISSPPKKPEIELPPATKKVFDRLNKHISFWSLQSIEPAILRWILIPFALPVLFSGALFYGVEMVYSSMPDERKNRWMFYCYHREHPLVLRAVVFGVSFPFMVASLAFRRQEGVCELKRE